MFYFFENTSLSIALGLALAIMAMQLTNTIHPPAGANPIIAILGAKTFEFVIMPVAIGASFIDSTSIVKIFMVDAPSKSVALIPN